jgi:surfactin synthase thioesterase subunit
LAYELAQALIARGCREPSMLFVGAAPAPSIWPRRHVGRAMSDAELRGVLAERGGTPPEFFEHPSLVDLFMPILRADFQLCDGAPVQGLPQLPCPVHVSAGLRDELSVSQLAAWRHVTNREFSLRWFDGDHFFIRSHASQLSAAIIQQLSHADALPSAAYASSAAS